MKSTRPTSRDIARLAEVSQATVSRALRNSPLVRPETRERIASIAQQLSYRTDRRAAGLRTRRSNTLALLLFEESAEDGQINPFFLSMLGHITRATARRGLDLLVSFQQLSDDWHTEYQLSNRADGLILLGYGDYISSMPRLQKLADAGANFVIWGPDVDGTPGRYVRTDNTAGGLAGDAPPAAPRTQAHRVPRQFVRSLARVPGAVQRLRAGAARSRHRARSAPVGRSPVE